MNTFQSILQRLMSAAREVFSRFARMAVRIVPKMSLAAFLMFVGHLSTEIAAKILVEKMDHQFTFYQIRPDEKEASLFSDQRSDCRPLLRVSAGVGDQPFSTGGNAV